MENSRLINWVKELQDEGETEYSISCGLDNGDIEKPDWMASKPNTLGGYAIWDKDESDGQTGLYILDTTYDGDCPLKWY